MNKIENENLASLISGIKDTVKKLGNDIHTLESKLGIKPERETGSINYNDFLRMQCKLKETCAGENCTECPYQYNGKKYYTGEK
ncbi:MAG: hypothetical protein SPF92_08505 [Clostridia bacterium]|nr:hypothetical protein [Clostridia bacterium]